MPYRKTKRYRGSGTPRSHIPKRSDSAKKKSMTGDYIVERARSRSGNSRIPTPRRTPRKSGTQSPRRTPRKSGAQSPQKNLRRPIPPSRKRVATASRNINRFETTKPKTTKPKTRSKTPNSRSRSRIDILSEPNMRTITPRATTPISKPRPTSRNMIFARSTPVAVQGKSLTQIRAMSGERKSRMSAKNSSNYGLGMGQGRNFGATVKFR